MRPCLHASGLSPPGPTSTCWCTTLQVRTVQGHHGTFQVIQDDLLHPVLGGNKLRKLDALLPALQESGATDVVGMHVQLLLAARHSVVSETSAAACTTLPSCHACWLLR